MNDTNESLLIPPEFYFQSTFEIPHQKNLESVIRAGKHPSISPAIPNLMFEPSSSEPFGFIYIAWNESGIAISAETIAPPANQDGKIPARTRLGNRPVLEFFIDTRDMKSNKRMNQFCHAFSLYFPTLKEKKAIGCKLIEDRSSSGYRNHDHNPSDTFPTAGSIQKNKCRASAWIPKENLSGFDSDNVPSLGFFYKLTDPFHLEKNQGEQYYGLGENFPYKTDPSLWASLKLSKS